MLFYLYECNDFYDDENGAPVPCEKEFWASDENLTICPRCGNESLIIKQNANFVEENVEVVPHLSTLGLDGERLVKEIEEALSKYSGGNIYMGIKENSKSHTVRLFYCGKHNRFDFFSDFVTDLTFNQLREICGQHNISWQED